MLDRIMGLFTGLIAGYLLGLTIGYTVFDPNLDAWALLGIVLALVGLAVGLTAFFRRHMVIVLCAILGFYLGALIGILLAGDITSDTLLGALENRTATALIVVGTVFGGAVGTWLHNPRIKHILFAVLIGGFFGGLLLSVLLGITKEGAMWETAPLVLLCGTIAGGLVHVTHN